jgi:predicted phosphate transport protein (TIGR00153 family)
LPLNYSMGEGVCMFIFFRKKEKSIFAKINRYLDQLDACKDQFIICITELINRGINGRNEEHVTNVHRAESVADDFRRDIECELYNRALIPDLRGDVLGILETVDRIPTYFQSICDQISLQKLEIPRTLVSLFHRLIRPNIEAYGLVNTAIKGYFMNMDIMKEITDIDKKESEADRIERALIREMFTIDMDKVERILLKDVVIDIGNISDQALIVSDRLSLAVIKRRI